MVVVVVGGRRRALGQNGCVPTPPSDDRFRDRHQRVDPVAAVARIVAELRSGRRLVIVDGLSASGKSTLAAAIVAEADTPTAIIRGDDFIRRGTTAWDRERFVRDVLEPLGRGEAGRYQPWPWDSDEPTGWVSVPAGSTVILEGIAVSDLDADRVPVGEPLVVWVEADDDERARRSARRAPHRFACWRDDWLPIERAWAERVRPWQRAHLVVGT